MATEVRRGRAEDYQSLRGREYTPLRVFEVVCAEILVCVLLDREDIVRWVDICIMGYGTYVYDFSTLHYR